MADLFRGTESGADAQSEAVRAYLQMYSGIADSWSGKWKRYMAEPRIARWHNGREQGYVITTRSPDFKEQMNIAFFEHRNSDSICALKWEQMTFNPPTIDNAQFGDLYTDKYDVSHSVSVGEAMAMADWIYEQLREFWEKNT